MKRNWWHAAAGVCFAANSVSLLMGGTRPSIPDYRLWVGMALLTSMICFVSEIRPSVRLQVYVTLAILLASGSRAVGAILFNEPTWAKYGGGSIWTLIFIAFLQLHRAERNARAIGSLHQHD